MALPKLAAFPDASGFAPCVQQFPGPTAGTGSKAAKFRRRTPRTIRAQGRECDCYLLSTPDAASRLSPRLNGEPARRRVGSAGVRGRGGEALFACWLREGGGGRRCSVVSASTAHPEVAVLVAAPEEEALKAAISAARAAAPPSCRIVGLTHTKAGTGMTVGSELPLEPLRWGLVGSEEEDGPGAWVLRGGTLEDAVTCALEPKQGLLACLGLSPALCLVGISREPSLGEDGDHSRSVQAAKRASVIGEHCLWHSCQPP